MSQKHRVVITGMGAISALGYTVDAFWQQLTAGTHGFRPLVLPEAERLQFKNAAQIPDYDSTQHFKRRQLRYLDPFAQYALLAAHEAIAQADIAWTDALRRRTGVITGAGGGGQHTIDAGYVDLYIKGIERVQPATVPAVMASAGASQVALAHGLYGPTFTVSSACASATHAIGLSAQMIQLGQAEVMITGGSEAPLSFGHLKAWDALRVVAPDACRPFSKDRMGMVLGEGGGMLVLEQLEHAQRRKATIWGEIVGFGMSSDAHHLTQPSADGAALAMQRALDDAALVPADVGYINAHGTGTLANDPMEIAAIKQVWGEHAHDVSISSTKSMHGHALGASGALEAIATVLALHHQLAPPTANVTEVDPACDLNVVPSTAQPLQTSYAISNSFAFGGLNAVLVLRNW